MEMWWERGGARRVLLVRGRRWRCGGNEGVRGGCCLYGVVNGDVVGTVECAEGVACTGSAMEMWWELSSARRVLLIRGRQWRCGAYEGARGECCLYGVVDGDVVGTDECAEGGACT